MSIDKEKIQTLDDEDDTPMDRANARVEAEMKVLENEAREQVAHGLQDQPIKEGGPLREPADQEQSTQEGTGEQG